VPDLPRRGGKADEYDHAGFTGHDQSVAIRSNEHQYQLLAGVAFAATAVIKIDEAWVVTHEDEADLRTAKASTHPKRREVVTLSLQYRSRGKLYAARSLREIIRDTADVVTGLAAEYYPEMLTPRPIDPKQELPLLVRAAVSVAKTKKALAALRSQPGFFTPTEIASMTTGDGGVSCDDIQRAVNERSALADCDTGTVH
jgi:hypothetical protein